ncbi:MAG: histidinol-phosphate aminotransferase family protein [Marinifilaceae bacterium]|jgi:threonine-phosphate decarboxylase|nr:histidinol-phosphate aminotransferase family protein [Marinifilaceae bacterium]
MINGHGNELAKYNGKIKIDFSSNIVHSGTNLKIMNHLRDNLSLISNYPEPDSEKLRNSLASFHNLSSDNIITTNGSAEAFYMIANYYVNKKSTVFIPSFAEYQDACISAFHKIDYVSSCDCKKYETDLIWIGNPNNPNGRVLSQKQIEDLCIENKSSIIIVDEAYAELCQDFESSISLVNTLDNLVVIKSLTKLFAIPGLRLGYIVSNSKLINKLRTKLIPWTVNSLANCVGNFIIDNYKELMPDVKPILEESSRVQSLISEIEGVKVHCSNTNYFLIEFEEKISKRLKEVLINDFGILVRDSSNFKSLDEKYIRIAVQGTKENDLLINILKNWKNLI